MHPDSNKTFRIQYDVHCKFENFFNKEILVKNCMNEIHAKLKLGEFLEKKYGKEFEVAHFKSIKEEGKNPYSDIFDSGIFGNNDFRDIFGIKKDKK